MSLLDRLLNDGIARTETANGGEGGRISRNFSAFPKIPKPAYRTTDSGERKVSPHCPKCASYALYRKNGIGDYECQTCGERKISEEVSRRMQ
jgi:hypothetical protein